MTMIRSARTQVDRDLIFLNFTRIKISACSLMFPFYYIVSAYEVE